MRVLYVGTGVVAALYPLLLFASAEVICLMLVRETAHLHYIVIIH